MQIICKPDIPLEAEENKNASGKGGVTVDSITGLAVKFYHRIVLLPSFLRRQESRETGLTLYV